MVKKCVLIEVGDMVAQRLVRRTWDLKVSSSSAFTLGSQAKHLTLTVLLSTQVYKWGPTNCLGTT